FKLTAVLSLGFFTLLTVPQGAPREFLETEATITQLDFSINGRRSTSTATVGYTTHDGVKRSSTVKIAHIPFIGPWNKVGDKITVRYDVNKPLLLTSPTTDFIKSYLIYALIALGVFYSIFRFYRAKKSKRA
ncbi:MAG: hypothetical protein ACPGU0_08385, partial [Marinirhabdus sp.]